MLTESFHLHTNHKLPVASGLLGRDGCGPRTTDTALARPMQFGPASRQFHTISDVKLETADQYIRLERYVRNQSTVTQPLPRHTSRTARIYHTSLGSKATAHAPPRGAPPPDDGRVPWPPCAAASCRGRGKRYLEHGRAQPDGTTCGTVNQRAAERGKQPGVVWMRTGMTAKVKKTDKTTCSLGVLPLEW